MHSLRVADRLAVSRTAVLTLLQRIQQIHITPLDLSNKKVHYVESNLGIFNNIFWCIMALTKKTTCKIFRKRWNFLLTQGTQIQLKAV